MKRLLLVLMLILGAVTITSRPVQTYAYTEEQKQQAKSWLSAHGYPPTRAGAEQAYQDYMDGKIDVPEADAYLGRNKQKKIEEKNNSYQEKEMEKMLEDVNSWGINVNKYVTEHRKVVPKSFISKMDPGRILTLIEQSNTENIEAFRYAINDLYSFSNLSFYIFLPITVSKSI